MKKVLVFALVGGMFALASCGGGPSAEEKAALEQARLDSIKMVEQAKLDEMAAAAAAAAAAEAEAAATEEEVAPAEKAPANIIEGKKGAAENAAENIIEGKKQQAAEEKESGEDMIQRKKGKGGN